MNIKIQIVLPLTKLSAASAICGINWLCIPAYNETHEHVESEVYIPLLIQCF